MPDKTPQLITENAHAAHVDPSVFTFRALQVTEAMAFGEGARTCVSVFGEVFQRVEAGSLNPRRICSARVEFRPNEPGEAHVGVFSFPEDMEVSPFMLAYVNVCQHNMQGLLDSLRTGTGIELGFRADIDTHLSDLIVRESRMSPDKRGGAYTLRTVSVSVSR